MLVRSGWSILDPSWPRSSGHDCHGRASTGGARARGSPTHRRSPVFSGTARGARTSGPGARAGDDCRTGAGRCTGAGHRLASDRRASQWRLPATHRALHDRHHRGAARRERGGACCVAGRAVQRLADRARVHEHGRPVRRPRVGDARCATPRPGRSCCACRCWRRLQRIDHAVRLPWNRHRHQCFPESVRSYAVVSGYRSDLIAGLILGRAPWSYALAGLTILLLGYAAWQEIRLYGRTRFPTPGALGLAYILLAEAQSLVVLAPFWSLAWWEYHVLMLAATIL